MNALLLGDGRFPSGGHAHSGGLEAAVAEGRVGDVQTLAAFLRGRLATAGLVAAGLAAAACTGRHGWLALDAEADARTASPALRERSRRQGRQLLRAAAAAWCGKAVAELASAVPAGAHHGVALGAASTDAGLGPADAALTAAYDAVAGPAAAGVRLLSLDPFAVQAVLAGLSAAVEEAARQGAAAAHGPLHVLPCSAAPLLDLGAEHHAGREVTLFAS